MLIEVFRQQQSDPAAIATALGVTVGYLADICRLPPDALASGPVLAGSAPYERLRDVALILDAALPLCGSAAEALSWFVSEPIPSFGGMTAQQAVGDGGAAMVRDYLARVADGGYA